MDLQDVKLLKIYIDSCIESLFSREWNSKSQGFVMISNYEVIV